MIDASTFSFSSPFFDYGSEFDAAFELDMEKNWKWWSVTRDEIFVERVNKMQLWLMMMVGRTNCTVQMKIIFFRSLLLLCQHWIELKSCMGFFQLLSSSLWAISFRCFWIQFIRWHIIILRCNDTMLHDVTDFGFILMNS